MPSVVPDASSLVGALLKKGSVPERALLLMLTRHQVVLSRAVLEEIVDVFARPKLARLVPPGRTDRMIRDITLMARFVEPEVVVTDCRDPKDNKYLELALAAGASAIMSSDKDLLVLHPWRGIPVLTPTEFLSRFT